MYLCNLKFVRGALKKCIAFGKVEIRGFWNNMHQ